MESETDFDKIFIIHCRTLSNLDVHLKIKLLKFSKQ